MFAVTTGTGTLLVFPVYHPAAVTHNPRLKGALEEDFKTLRSVLEREGVV
jgi:uracil-DNA glycosylase